MKKQRAAIATASAAFILAALVVVSTIGVVWYSYSSDSSHNTRNGAYGVAFQQIEACSSFWGVPWAVTIANVTKTQPAGTDLPITYLSGTSDRSLAEIDFELPSGSYNYTVSPSQGYFIPSSGSFVVSNSNITIPIAYTGTSCTTTTGSINGNGSPIPISSVEKGNITIGGSPRTIAVNPVTNMIYIADFFYNNLTVVDATTDSVVARIALPANDNNGIAIDSKTSMVYVLVEGGIAEVNGSTNKVVGELPLNFGPGSMAYDSSNHVIYGSGQTGNGSLIGADVRTGRIVMNVPLGYWANSVAVDPTTNVVFAVGCKDSFVCDSIATVVNGTNGGVLNQVTIGNDAYPRVVMNLATIVAYVSGSASLVALNGTTGKILYDTNSMACGPFDSMAADAQSNQLLAVSDSEYLLAYDGTSGMLLNMYSFPGTPGFTQSVAYNPTNDEAYVTYGSQLVAFELGTSNGHINSTLVESGQNCPLP